MGMRKAVWAALAGGMFALGSGGAQALTLCATIHTIGDWQAAGTCSQLDKDWTIGDTTFDKSVVVDFSGGADEHILAISHFDLGTDAGDWTLHYTIDVTTLGNFISDMAAESDNPFGTSLLTKKVSGDPGGDFTLFDVNGGGGPLSKKSGLDATELKIDESVHVDKDSVLVSVSNVYLQGHIHEGPEPGTLVLLGTSLLALGALRRRKSS